MSVKLQERKQIMKTGRDEVVGKGVRTQFMGGDELPVGCWTGRDWARVAKAAVASKERSDAGSILV